uniref:Band 4.1 C-terminal domain-containing protein n=1 Tax=Oryzias latipes TaxID=8090 RepID=A0A3B3HFV9_ORYLA
MLPHLCCFLLLWDSPTRLSQLDQETTPRHNQEFLDKSQDVLLKHQASINELKRALREPNSKLINREKRLSGTTPTGTPEKKALGGRVIGKEPVNSLSVEGFIQKTYLSSPEGSEEWVLIEKQHPYQDHDWKAEEENKLCTSEKKELRKEIDFTKMMHAEGTGYHEEETKSHTDEFPSTPEAGSETLPSGTLSSDNADFLQDRPPSKLSHASDQEVSSDVAPGAEQMKERTASKTRKKRRPQSFNLAMPTESGNRKTESDSSVEENEGSDSDNSSERPCKGGTCSSPKMFDDQGSGQDPSVRVCKDYKPEDLPAGDKKVSNQAVEQVKRKVHHAGTIDLGFLNGPVKMEPDSSLSASKGESAAKVRGKGLIDNKELAEVKLRQVRTHERKISSSCGEDVEGVMGERNQRTSLHRLSGSSYQSEITRIVPLKPERSKSVACRDEREYQTAKEEPAPPNRREYRWSLGSPEASSDLNWTDVPTFPPADPEGLPKADQPCDSFQSARGSNLKMAPPAPPVKTKKARESGLILRNSRNASREPSLESAKKRLSEPVSTHAIYEEPLADFKKEPGERRPHTVAASEEEQECDTVASMRESQLGIERKCSSMTVSSTSSLEAEVDFTVITDSSAEPGERERQPEVGREDFEETSRFYSARLMGFRDKSPMEEKLPEEGPLPEIDGGFDPSSFSSSPLDSRQDKPPVAKKDSNAVSAAHKIRRSDSRTETHTNGSEVHPASIDVSPQNCGVMSPPVAPAALKENGSPVKAGTQERESVVSPLTITAEAVTSATTTQVTKTVKGGYSETRIEKRIIITGDDDVDQHQALAMAIQEAKQQHPDMLVTKAVVIRETESPTEDFQQKAES